MITAAQLMEMFPHCPRAAAQSYELPLSDAMREFCIDTPKRQAAFLAQIGHESGQLRYTRERWGPSEWQVRYENNVLLGNNKIGDGKKFMGRGLIQITGRSNYRTCSQALFDDASLLDKPELLEEPVYAARSAAWFFYSHGLNELADSDSFERITKRINPAMLGMEERTQLWQDATRVLT